MTIKLNPNAHLYQPVKHRAEVKPGYFCSRTSFYALNQDYTLLLNSLSGAIDVIDKKELGEIKGLQQGDLNMGHSLYKTLFRRGYLFGSLEEENSHFRKVCHEVSLSPATGMGFYIFVSSFCNFACSYCFEGKMAGKRGAIREEMVKGLFSSIDALRKKNNIPRNKVVVKIFGGEPLLEPNRATVAEILDRCLKNNYTSTITTNGYTMDHFMNLLEKYKNIIHFIHTTLDGPPHIHNANRILKNGGSTFEKIASNVNNALNRGFRILLRTNLDRRTLPHLKELIELYILMGWHKKDNLQLQLIPVFDICKTGRIKNLISQNSVYNKIEPLLHHISEVFRNPPLSNFWGQYICNHLARAAKIDMGYTELYPSEGVGFHPMAYGCLANQLRDVPFLPDGKIYPCVVTAGRSRFAIGRWCPSLILQRKKSALWISRNVGSIRSCNSCPVAFFCGGGCPVKRSSCTKYDKMLAAFIRKHRRDFVKFAASK